MLRFWTKGLTEVPLFVSRLPPPPTQILLLAAEVPGGMGVQRRGVPKCPDQPTDAGRSHARRGAAGAPESGKRAGVLILPLLHE